MSLAQNRLHVLANHLQVSGTHVSKISSNDEHLAGEAEREVRLVREGDTEEERSVLNGMADVVYDLAVDLGIALAKLLPAFPDAFIDLPAFLVGNRGNGRAPDPHDFRLLREQLDDFRFHHRFETRSDAIRWLLSWALSRKPDPKKQDK